MRILKVQTVVFKKKNDLIESKNVILINVQ